MALNTENHKTEKLYLPFQAAGLKKKKDWAIVAYW